MRAPLVWSAALCAGALALLPAGAHAQETPRRELRYDLRKDFGATFVLFSLSLAAELAKADLAPAHCRLCDKSPTAGFNVVDQPLRNALRWKNARLASLLSDFGLLTLPIGVVSAVFAFAALEGQTRTGLVDVAIVAEAAGTTMLLTQIAKFTAARERPFVHALPEGEKARTQNPIDNNLSFFSGHTAMVFASATAGGTVASMREYTSAPVVWALGLSVAAASGYLRIAGDRHYFSDVLTGALVGSAVGVALPLLFHRPVITTKEPGAVSSPLEGNGVPVMPRSYGVMSFSGTF